MSSLQNNFFNHNVYISVVYRLKNLLDSILWSVISNTWLKLRYLYIKAIIEIPVSHVHMSLVLSPGSLDPEHPCCTLSWGTVPLALPPHLLIKRFFWNRAYSFPLPMNVPLESHHVSPSHSRSTSWAIRTVNAVAPSFACFRTTGHLVSQLPNTCPLRNTGGKEEVVMPLSNLLTFSSPGAQGWVQRFWTSKNTLWKKIKFQSLHLAETSQHDVEKGEITKRCLWICTLGFFF